MGDESIGETGEVTFQQTDKDDEIEIYEGAMKLHSAMDLFQKPESKGKVVYSWYPFPRIYYELKFDECDGTVFGDGFSIMHEGLARPTNFYKLWEGDNGHVKGFVEVYESPGRELKFDSILFQFANLTLFVQKMAPDGQRYQSARELLFSIGEFSIVLKNTFEMSQLKSITGRQGNILNGVVEIKKRDGLIEVAEATDLVGVFFEFLSFCNGLRVKPIVLIGVLGGVKKYIRFCTHTRLPSFSAKKYWMPLVVEEDRINKSWRSIYELCKQEEEKDFIELAIHWYLESLSMSSGVEASISLVQNALELLSSRILYEKEYILSKAEKGERVSASSKINILLTWAGVPLAIPDRATQLVQFAKEKLISTGPGAITQIRNSIVHPDTGKRAKYKKMDLGLKKQALDLALQYVELVLLRVLRYDGTFYNCFSNHPIDQFRCEQVPWLSSQTQN